MKTLLSIITVIAAIGMVQAANPPINDTCPVCGKKARLIYRYTNPKGERVIFDTSECQEKFEKSPNSYKVTPAGGGK